VRISRTREAARYPRPPKQYYSASHARRRGSWIDRMATLPWQSQGPWSRFPISAELYALEFNGEQAVNPDSRVSLGAAQDRFGMLQLRIDWRSSSIDIETIKHAYKMLGDRFRETRAGQLDYSADRLVDRVKAAGAYGGHHIGTARMSEHPNGGVVNANGAVHGFRNLLHLRRGDHANLGPSESNVDCTGAGLPVGRPPMQRFSLGGRTARKYASQGRK